MNEVKSGTHACKLTVKEGGTRPFYHKLLFLLQIQFTGENCTYFPFMTAEESCTHLVYTAECTQKFQRFHTV